MIDVEKLGAEELVATADHMGLVKQIRGKGIEAVRDIVREHMEALARTHKEAGEPKAVADTEDDRIKSLSWPDLKKLAKDKGINPHKKKRVEIETLLKVMKPEKLPTAGGAKEITISTSTDTQILKLTNESRAQATDICALGQRIDKLVEAINSSKSVEDI